MKKEFWFFCALCFCLCWCLAAPQAEQWYRISETELSTFETISRTWATDRQGWLSQASVLKQVAQDLQADSASLNLQLEAERTKTQSLRRSFERSEADRLKKASEYETAIRDLTAAEAAAKLKTERMKNQRNILLALFGTVSLVLFTKIIVKMRLV